MPLYSALKPLLFSGDPEQVHNLVTAMASTDGAKLFYRCFTPPQPEPSLSQSFWGQTFRSPVGLAGGFDKHVRLVDFARWLGFGFSEVGAISALPSPGNPCPRLFRLVQDEALINRMGLNNEGAEALRPLLEALPQDWPVGINITKTPRPDIVGADALKDLSTTLTTIMGLGCYVSLDVSCPNTQDGQTFSEPTALKTLLSTLAHTQAAHLAQHPSLQAKPWMVKLSPDLPPDHLADLVELVTPFIDQGLVGGWIACNTSRHRLGLKTSNSVIESIGRGGLSGPPVRSASLSVVKALYELTQGQQLIVGVGGINSVEAAWDYIGHGARLIQVYTGLVYEGPGFIHTLNQGLAKKLRQHGFETLESAVGWRYL